MPQPGDPPREICPGTTICLDLLFYCHEAYLYEAGGCFDLYKKCGASPMTKIDFGDPLGSLLRSGCEFYAVAERPGYSELSLWGEDSWGRPKEGFAPLRYEVCHDCNGVCYDPATEGCCNGTKYTLATHGCCPATQPADEKVYRKDDQACCGPKAIVYNVYSKKCCQAVEPEDWKTVDLLMQDCCGPEAIPYDKNFEGCCGPSKHHNPPLWLVYDYETECCEPCDMVPKTKPPEFPPSACRAPDCAGEYFCCGSDGNTYEAIAMTSAEEFSACQTAGRLRPKWNNPGKTEYNGCGPEGMFHPDLFDNPPELIGCDVPPFGNTGSAPCDHHDLRYGNCGCNKAAGDSEFKDHMDAICHQLEDGICKDTCYAVAWAYYNAVANFGDDAFRAAQIEDCLCCQQP